MAVESPVFEGKLRNGQSFRSAVQIEGEESGTIQHFPGQGDLGSLRIPEDQEGTLPVRRDDRPGERRGHVLPLLHQAVIKSGITAQLFNDLLPIGIPADDIAAQPDLHSHRRQPDGGIGSRPAQVIAVGFRKDRVFGRGQAIRLDNVIHADLAVAKDITFIHRSLKFYCKFDQIRSRHF